MWVLRHVLCHLTFSTKNVLFLRSGEMGLKIPSFLCLAHSINLLADDSKFFVFLDCLTFDAFAIVRTKSRSFRS